MHHIKCRISWLVSSTDWHYILEFSVACLDAHGYPHLIYIFLVREKTMDMRDPH